MAVDFGKACGHIRIQRTPAGTRPGQRQQKIRHRPHIARRPAPRQQTRQTAPNVGNRPQHLRQSTHCIHIQQQMADVFLAAANFTNIRRQRAQIRPQPARTRGRLGLVQHVQQTCPAVINGGIDFQAFPRGRINQQLAPGFKGIWCAKRHRRITLGIKQISRQQCDHAVRRVAANNASRVRRIHILPEHPRHNLADIGAVV